MDSKKYRHPLGPRRAWLATPQKRAAEEANVRTAMSHWLYRWVENKRKDWSTLRGGTALTHQQFIEMLLAYAVDNLDADYIKAFVPRSKSAGRPNPRKLGSDPEPTVREDQLGSTEDEREADDRAD